MSEFKDYTCGRCDTVSSIMKDTTKLMDNNNIEVKFRHSCTNCGYVEPLTEKDIAMFLFNLDNKVSFMGRKVVFSG